MTIDELYTAMQRDESEITLTESRSQDWADSTLPNDLYGMMLLRRLAPKSTAGRMLAATSHDMVYYTADLEEVAEHATHEDVDLLVMLGFFLDQDSLAIFV